MEDPPCCSYSDSTNQRHRSVSPRPDNNSNARNIGGGANSQSSVGESCNSKTRNKHLSEKYDIKYPSSHAVGIHSATSLSFSKSSTIETPFGVVRQSSSSGSAVNVCLSSESFKREISMFKMNAMPALEEVAPVCEDEADEIGGKCKTRDKSKIKRSHKKNARRPVDPAMVLVEVDLHKDPEQNSSVSSKGPFSRLVKVLRQLVLCRKDKQGSDKLMEDSEQSDRS